MKWDLRHKFKYFFNSKLVLVFGIFVLFGGAVLAQEVSRIILTDAINSNIFEITEPGEAALDGSTMTWEIDESRFTNINHKLIYNLKVKVKDSACENQANLKITNTASIAWSSSTNTDTADPLRLKCPLFIEGDVGATNIDVKDIVKVKGPAAVIATGTSESSNVISTDNSVQIITKYNNDNLKDLVKQVKDKIAEITPKAVAINSLGLCSENDVLIRKWTGGDLTLKEYTSDCNQTLIVNTGTDIIIENGFTGAVQGKSFGLVQLGGGKITFNQKFSDKIQNLAIFAPDSDVVINLYGGDGDRPFLMSGMIVAKNIYVKQNNGTNSWGGKIGWSGQIAQDPPPGFEKAVELSKISEVAPE